MRKKATKKKVPKKKATKKKVPKKKATKKKATKKTKVPSLKGKAVVDFNALVAFCKKFHISYPLNPDMSHEDIQGDKELQQCACKDLFNIIVGGRLHPMDLCQLFPLSIERIDELNS